MNIGSFDSGSLQSRPSVQRSQSNRWFQMMAYQHSEISLHIGEIFVPIGLLSPTRILSVGITESEELVPNYAANHDLFGPRETDALADHARFHFRRPYCQDLTTT